MAANAPVPYFNSLAEIYPTQAAVFREGQRWNTLATKFEALYGSKPEYIVRAPGRVNVLGEHIDYSLFPVLPAAIEQDIVFAITSTTPSPGQAPSVRLQNYDKKHTYPGCEFPLVRAPGGKGWDVGLDKAGCGWDNYVRVALLECLDELCPVEGGAAEGVKGLDVLVSGTVPPGSGLSSSAAMVVGSVIVFLVANGLDKGKTKADVVRLAIASEHRMGLRTGGMDQSASALALPHTLIHLTFHPTLSPSPLPLPPSLALVITNSLAPHSLTDSAPEQYNLRVVEMLCATRLLAHRWGVGGRASAGETKEEGGDEVREVMWLYEVLGHWARSSSGSPSPINAPASREPLTWEEQGAVLRRALDDIEWLQRPEGWTREEMVQASGMEEGEFEKSYLMFLEIRADRFFLYERTLHTLTESLRVHEFANLCREIALSPSPTTSASATIDPRFTQLGDLLNASHTSMSTSYACTHPLVDSLQSLCANSGALGSRMTGGGWGGAVVSLVPEKEVPGFLEKVRAGFEGYEALGEEEWGEVGFASMPGYGAGVYVVGGEVV
ncbi:galactokinase [Cryptococcus sp. DSM 104549]